MLLFCVCCPSLRAHSLSSLRGDRRSNPERYSIFLDCRGRVAPSQRLEVCGLPYRSAPRNDDIVLAFYPYVILSKSGFFVFPDFSFLQKRKVGQKKKLGIGVISVFIERLFRIYYLRYRYIDRRFFLVLQYLLYCQQ